uniref:Apple domain-containing protein n=1 Tax=Acrobeloides nanus TaxID=290746 RepID=A0A914CMP5_9BILA
MVNMVISFLIVIFSVAYASHHPNHFGDSCWLCECYVEYTDRDVALPSIPYKIVQDAYEATEDRCLAACINDEECKAVVYGLTGGRDVFTCELYDQLNTRPPIYTPYVNTYIKRSSKCEKSTNHLLPLDLVDGDEKVLERKSKHLKLQHKLNPFHFG